MKSIHLIDWSIIISYFLFLIWIGIFSNRNSKQNQNDFILSGRKLSTIGFIATLVTTWYGGILGIGENTILYGVQTWFIFAFPYYFFAIIYAFWVAPRVKRKGHLSLPDHFHNQYGEASGITAALIITFLASPAPYVLSLGILLQFLFGIELTFALLLSTFFSIIYIWHGGFSAVVATDRVQFVFMFLGFFALLGFLWHVNGSPVEMFKSLPANMLDPLGGNTLSYLFVWFFIAAWTFIDPGFYQRCCAAKDVQTAKYGILISIVFWAIFDFTTLICGLYAIGKISTDQALFTFPLLASGVLPKGFLGLFITGLIAIIMSTVDSLSHISAITFGRDILWRIEKDFSIEDSTIHMKKVLIIISFFSLVIAYLMPSVVKLFYTLGSILIPGLILPFLFSLKNDFLVSSSDIVKWMIAPIIASSCWFSVSQIMEEPFLGIEPFYPGMATSILFIIIIKIRKNHGN